MLWQKRHEAGYNSEIWTIVEIAWAIETRNENNLEDQIILRVLQWQTRPSTEYNLEVNYIEGLHLAKEMRKQIRLGNLDRIKTCKGKRDPVTNAIWRIKLC